MKIMISQWLAQFYCGSHVVCSGRSCRDNVARKVSRRQTMTGLADALPQFTIAGRSSNNRG